MKRLSFLKVIGAGVGASIIPPVFINKENTKFIDSESLKKPNGYDSKIISQYSTLPTWEAFDRNIVSTTYMCFLTPDPPSEDGTPKHTCKVPKGGVKGGLSGVWYYE